MPRPKGSKNKAKTSSIATTDFTSLIAEKAEAKESLTAEVATLEENLESIKADLKTKKAELKKLDTELAKLEAKKADMEVISRTQTENNPLS